MDITVQWGRTSWTKRSRGGAAAARRNAAPVGFALPSGVGPVDRHRAFGPIATALTSGAHAEPVAHVVRLREEDGFAPREGHELLRRVGLSLREADGRLRVLPRVEPLFGLPPRPRRPPAVRLAPGQWVRWQLNYRFSSASGIRDWSYWMDTFNVAYGPVADGVFLSSPTVSVDERGPLR